jgi:hypothetical protein
VARLAPLLLHVRDLAGGDRAAVDCSDDQVVCAPVLDRFVAVGVDAPVEAVELVAEAADGAGRQVAVGEASVCLRLIFNSPLKARLSQVKTLVPVTSPSGKVLSWLLRRPTTQA